MLTILIVDDNDDLRNLVRIQLQKHGYTCLEAASGCEALEVLESNSADLVLMDMNMPELDGWQTSSRIRTEIKSLIPIIALTAYSMPGDRARAMAAGCNAFHCKPIDFELLLAEIQRCATGVEN